MTKKLECSAGFPHRMVQDSLTFPLEYGLNSQHSAFFLSMDVTRSIVPFSKENIEMHSPRFVLNFDGSSVIRIYFHNKVLIRSMSQTEL